MALLPTVSIGITVWNGEAFLSEALESLLAQDYENLEIIILDNLSTDRTQAICKAYAQKDARIKYILDDRQRDVMQGQKKIAQHITGEFFMGACDDDWYAPEYVSTLMSFMTTNQTVGLAYSGWGHVYPDGSRKPVDWKHFFKATNSEFKNFIYYLFFRIPIPMVFGVVRTELHRDCLQYYYRPDHRGWNHDNLYMLRLLSMARVDSTANRLFYYRQRERVELYKQRGQYHCHNGIWRHYLNSVLHQFSVSKAVSKIIEVSNFTRKQKCILKAYNLFVMIYYCEPRHLLTSPVVRIIKGMRRFAM